MARYNNIRLITPRTSSGNLPRRYSTVKYPEIPKDFSDTYVYATQGDRYDLLANDYYNDSSLWWIISTANYEVSYDSITPPHGTQIRIPSPSRLSSILSRYESLNFFNDII